MAGPLTSMLLAVCAIAQQCSGAQHSIQGAGATGAGDSAVWLVPSLACYLLAVCAIVQQCSGAQHALLGAGATGVGGLSCMAGPLTSMLPASCLCYCTTVWWGPALLPGCWCH
jgi:hypothetical protein